MVVGDYALPMSDVNREVPILRSFLWASCDQKEASSRMNPTLGREKQRELQRNRLRASGASV